MTDAWSYTEENEMPEANGPKALRDYAKSQKDRADAAEARIAAVEARLRHAEVADLFEAQGVPRGAAQYYTGDTDPAKVTSWVNDMRTAFGGAPAPIEQPITPTVSPTDQAQIQQMMQAGSGASTQTNYDAAYSSLSDPNLSQAERVAAWQNFARTQQS